jgi:hypothetical protein
MPGKLPIDRVRQNEDGPDAYEPEKQRLTQQRAPRRARPAPGVAAEARQRGVRPEGAAGGAAAAEATEQEADRA